jgi:alanine racemase
MRPLPTVSIDHARIARNAGEISARTARPIYAVIKADAYGLGATAVARAVADVVHGFYAFELAEAVQAELKPLGKPVIALDHATLGRTADDYIGQGVRPIVFSAVRARELRRASPVLAIDTGMQRFGCPEADVALALHEGGITEVMTHAVRIEQVRRLIELTGGRQLVRHAAGTALLDTPEAFLDATRPGLALYRGAMTVTASVVEARDTPGVDIGYSGFRAGRIGVILGGYTAGLQAGPCLVRGQPRRVLEVGMQSSYVELLANEGPGDEVTLLGPGLSESALAAAWQTSEQQVLVRLGRNRI